MWGWWRSTGVYVAAFVVGSSSLFGATASTELYSEQVYLERESRYQGNFRIREQLAVTPTLMPYVQAGGELFSAFGAGLASPSSGSYGFVSPGVRYRPIDFASLYVEPRFRYSLSSDPKPASLDFRTLAVLGKLWVSPLSGDLSSLVEAYSETLLTSFDKWNLIEAAYLRGGLRYRVLPTANLDLFLEPFVTFDRIGHYYNNRSDLKLSARFEATGFAGLTMSLTGSLLANTYFAGRSSEVNPYRGKTMGFRILAVVGGTW